MRNKASPKDISLTIRNSPTSRFEACWLAQTIRLQELENPAAVHTPASLPQAPSIDDATAQDWVLLRAQHIAIAQGLEQRTTRWLQNARLLISIVAILVIISGVSATLGFFGSNRSINLIWTLIGLIGVHFVALVAWLVFGRIGGGLLGKLSFWAMSHWPGSPKPSASGKDAHLSRALFKVMSQGGYGKWVLSGITHLGWLLALFASLLTMLLMLSVRNYSFVLETTILSDVVVGDLVRAFSYLPSRVGFATPSAEMINAALSGTDPLQTEVARRAWASWLSGGLLLYAIAPRAIVGLYCLLRFLHARTRLALNLEAPGFVQLFARGAAGQHIVDAAPTALCTVQIATAQNLVGEARALLALELGKDLVWPPPVEKNRIDILIDEVVDTREQRKAALQILQAKPAKKLLLVCDARVSPDRGSLIWLAELSAFAGNVGVCVLSPSKNVAADRREIWKKSLINIGLAEQNIFYEQADAFGWLLRND